jgi:hypothetical protein
MDNLVKRNHFGDVRESDGKIFVNYRKKQRKDGTPYLYGHWVTPEVFEKRKLKNRIYNNKPDVKSKRQKIAKEKRKDPKYRLLRREGKKRWLDKPETKAKVDQWRKEYLERPDVKKRIKERMYKYRHDPEVKKRDNKRRKTRRDNDPQYALKERVRSRVRIAIKKAGAEKSTTTKELIGCSYAFLREYLEKQFREGMSWSVPNSFHIDHIKPLISFNLTDPEQLKEACHYTNLQPLYPVENLKKSDKILTTIN